MKFIPTQIPDVIIIQPKVFGDDRGYFMESFRQDLLSITPFCPVKTGAGGKG